MPASTGGWHSLILLTFNLVLASGWVEAHAAAAQREVLAAAAADAPAAAVLVVARGDEALPLPDAAAASY